MNLTKQIKQDLLLNYVKKVYFPTWEKHFNSIVESATKLAVEVTSKQREDFLALDSRFLNYVNTFEEVKVNLYYTGYWGKYTNAKETINMLYLIAKGKDRMEYDTLLRVIHPSYTYTANITLSVPRYLADSPSFSVVQDASVNALVFTQAYEVFNLAYLKEVFKHIKEIGSLINSCSTSNKLAKISPKLAELLPIPEVKPNQIVPSELIQQINSNLS